MTTTWHEDSCRHPDVYLVEESRYCGSCNVLAPLDQVVLDDTITIPAIPELPHGGTLQMTWPQSVEFWHDQDVSTGSSTARRENLKATGLNQQYTKVDNIQQQMSSSASKSREVYTTLHNTDQIRLLLLSKGSFEDPIHGTLVNVRLSSNIEFRALSYTWADATGDASRSAVTFLGPRWDILMVTANCKAALRRLRQKDDDCLVWVDAICIDQGNPLERNHQVGLMRRIYSEASEVFVYLGEASSSSKEAFERLRWAKNRQTIDEKGRLALSELFNMRYFHRIWVIQEVANAKSAIIHYGDDTLGWSILDEERLQILGIYEDVPKWISSIYLRREYTVRELPALLFSTFSTKASDPRDKVFGLLGLIKDADRFRLTADYSLTVQEVQVGISALFLMHEHDCSILTYAVGANSNSPAKLPSWVSTWDRQYRSDPIPRGSKAFGGYVILQGEHVMPHVLMSPPSDAWSKPRIHHFGGFLSILALKMIDLSSLTDSWNKYLGDSFPGHVFEFVPGLALHLDEEPVLDADEIVLLKDCETIFHIRKHFGGPNKYKIIGVCNILLSRDKLNWDQRVNKSELDIVSHFILQSFPLERRHLKQMIELEALMKQLGCWDSESYPSLNFIIFESMFSDSLIAGVFAAHIKEFGAGLTQSEPTSSEVKDDGTGNQGLLPIASQVQWLTTRLRFWDSLPCWGMVQPFSDIYSDWIRWRDLKAKVERGLFSSLQITSSLSDLRVDTRGGIGELSALTTSLFTKLLQVAGASCITQCQLRFGEMHLLVYEQVGSSTTVRVTKDAIFTAICTLFEQSHTDHYTNKQFLAGFQNIDNKFFLFTRWDWSELEAMFEPLEPFHSSETQDLKSACSSRISLRQLQPQGSKWEWVTLM